MIELQQIALNQGYDIVERDRFRRPREQVAPLLSPPTIDQSAGPQLAEYLDEVVCGYRLRLGQFFDVASVPVLCMRAICTSTRQA